LDGDSATDSAVRRSNAAIRAEQASGRSGKRRRFRLSEWRLPTKLMVVLLVPTLAALVFAGLRVYTQIKQANDLDYLLQQIDLHAKVYEAADQVEKESQVASTFAAGGRRGDRASVDAQQQSTDDAVEEVRTAAEAFYEESDASVQAEYDGLFYRLDNLPAIREVATGATSQYDAFAVAGIYSDITTSILQVGQLARSDVGGGQLTSRLSALNAVATAKAQIAQQVSFITVAATGGTIRGAELNELRAAVARHDSAIANFGTVATFDEQQRFNDTLVGPALDQLKVNRQLILVRGNTSQALGVDPADVVQAGTTSLGLYRTIEQNELSDLRDAVTTLRNGQQEATLRDAAIVLAVLLLAVLLALLVARSLLKPLRILRSNALDVAYSRLPQTVRRILADPDPVAASKTAVEPVPIFTREETGQLARSFDAVQEQAVLMATEQALLRDNINSIFVNLSRRSQALVERQLSLIDRLEQDEQDPDQLASLFELDHLATRMRRNSESLLVLSGTGLSRQLSRPVPASDVVGAAVSEVEHYARIEVASAPDVAVQGRAVSDLVHVIAELLDNATFFSPTEKKVIVRMAMTRKKELAIQITDQGVGMSEDEIGATNARLADPPDLDVAVTRRMGLYVVARLAKRHNIAVRLRDNEDIEGGLIARINVPAELVQPIGAAPKSMSSGPSTTGSLAIAADTSTEAQLAAPTNAPSRNSGIAGAFTGGMPRLRDNTPSLGADTSQDRTAAEVASYPPFNTGAGGYDGPDTGEALLANGTPGHPTTAEQLAIDGAAADQNGGHGGQGGYDGYDGSDNTATLFGSPLPEQPVDLGAEATGYFGAQGTSHPPEQVDHNVDAPTERLPIYEAVLSQWFESTDTGSAPAAARNVEAPPPPEVAHNGANGTNGTNGSIGTNGSNGVHAPEPEPEPAPEPTPWTSPGDDGWLLAQALLEDKTPDATTTAGLPKRVPKAHLVPGSAAPRHEADEDAPAAPSLPPRSADAIRGRMSSFQQGVRRGRHALIDAYAGDQSGSEQSRQDEEQE
jgi:signal transduction histidine kinase